MGNDTPLKERIRRGDVIIGVGVPIGSTKSQAEDILGKDDYGFITCDSQHSPFSEHKLVEHCNMADELGIAVHFRMKHPELAFLIGNIADLGPAFIEIPLVENPSNRQGSSGMVLLPARRTPKLGRRLPLGRRTRT